MVFGISKELIKRVIDTYKKEGASFNANAEFALIKDNISKDYSAISFLDIGSLINSITSSTMFKGFKAGLENNPNFPGKDLDLILSALGSLKESVMTVHKAKGEDLLESNGVLTIGQ